MGDISKIILPNGDSYNFKVYSVNGHTVNSDVPKNAVFTDTTYNIVNSSTDGLMSIQDKSRLDNLSGAVASKTQPSNQSAGDVWLVISEKSSLVTPAAEGVSF